MDGITCAYIQDGVILSGPVKVESIDIEHVRLYLPNGEVSVTYRDILILEAYGDVYTIDHGIKTIEGVLVFSRFGDTQARKKMKNSLYKLYEGLQTKSDILYQIIKQYLEGPHGKDLCDLYSIEPKQNLPG